MEKLMTRLPGISERPSDPLALARMRMETANRAQGQLRHYDCTVCRNRGYIMTLDGEGNLLSRPCKCLEIRRCVANMKRSGMEHLMEKRFDNFSSLHPWQETLVSACKDFMEETGRWLVLCGQSGSGKTHLCSAVCRELLLQGQRVRYMLWREASNRLRDMGLDADTRHEEKEQYKSAPVLYIDDLLKTGGNGAVSSGELSLAFEILNHRYVQGLTTLISTELSPDDLMRLDQALGGRILEKAGRYLLYIAPDKEKNMRLQKNITG